MVYRFEMLGCCYNIMARLYVLWQPLAASIMRDVPNKQNVAAFANVKFDSYFVCAFVCAFVCGRDWHVTLACDVREMS